MLNPTVPCAGCRPRPHSSGCGVCGVGASTQSGLYNCRPLFKSRRQLSSCVRSPGGTVMGHPLPSVGVPGVVPGHPSRVFGTKSPSLSPLSNSCWHTGVGPHEVELGFALVEQRLIHHERQISRDDVASEDGAIVMVPAVEIDQLRVRAGKHARNDRLLQFEPGRFARATSVENGFRPLPRLRETHVGLGARQAADPAITAAAVKTMRRVSAALMAVNPWRPS